MTALRPEDLRRTCDAGALGFATTADVAPLRTLAGQPRAVAALELALDGGLSGHHVFITGPAGTGRRTSAEAHLRRRAAARPAPPDRVYVHDFEAPARPRMLTLPSGRGGMLRLDVSQLVSDARRALAEAFEAEAFRSRHHRLHEQADSRRQRILTDLQTRAAARGVAVEPTPVGAAMLPIVDGRPVPPMEMENLPPERLRAHEKAVEELGDIVGAAFDAIRAVELETTAQHRELERETAAAAIGVLVDGLAARWDDVPAVGSWILALRDDMLRSVPALRADPDEAPGGMLPPGARLPAFASPLRRYEVNVVVTHPPTGGAPVEVCPNATYDELFGRLEYDTSFGGAHTDHGHLRAGAVHRASGGYLLLDAADALSRPFVWGRLKEVLKTRRARIENPGREMLLFPTASLDAEPMDIDLTVALVGSPRLYHLLFGVDEDVAKLFTVRADFDEEMPWDADGERIYAALLSRRAEEAALPPFSAAAVARLVEHGARLAGRRNRLTTRLAEIQSIGDEAAHWARTGNAPAVGPEHVERALTERRRRSDLAEQRVRERLADGSLRIDVSGAVVGQVNGLAVASPGDHAFGHPVRITATVSPGAGAVVDIDREAELSGPLHDKGVMILAGCLRELYAADVPLGLQASLVFEQSYGPVEGDSASCAELLAIISALARVPLRQGIAMTGSIDQRGAVQAVGGIGEKVEGFFATCRERGLTGDQGVVIPTANMADLMLETEVVQAVAAGRFHIWAVDRVDEAAEILTGLEAGTPDAEGAFPEDSLHGCAQRRALALAEAARRHGRLLEELS